MLLNSAISVYFGVQFKLLFTHTQVFTEWHLYTFFPGMFWFVLLLFFAVVVYGFLLLFFFCFFFVFFVFFLAGRGVFILLFCLCMVFNVNYGYQLERAFKNN